MKSHLATAQTLRYAEELGSLFAEERAQRKRADQALKMLDLAYRATVSSLAAALELRDDNTGQHATRVTNLGLRLAARVAPDLYEDRMLEYAFLLHDIGKIGVPDRILLKPGRLAPNEQERIRAHPELGERILAGVPFFGPVVREVVRSHHEWWDGTGYPDGHSGEAIPLAARVFSIVDAYDAMTNNRPYRAAVPHEVALAEIRASAGKQFDPTVVEHFLTLLQPGETRRA